VTAAGVQALRNTCAAPNLQIIREKRRAMVAPFLCAILESI
jgi:hypothetical protein